MHETGVCRNIVETVEEYALMNHAKKVTRVRIKLGEIHDIVPDILIGAFEWMSRGTVVEGAQMVIERVPFTVKCQKCGEVYPLNAFDESTWACPTCHERDYRLNTGREFSIETIDVERYASGETDQTQKEVAAFMARRPAPAASRAVSGKRPASVPHYHGVAARPVGAGK